MYIYTHTHNAFAKIYLRLFTLACYLALLATHYQRRVTLLTYFVAYYCFALPSYPYMFSTLVAITQTSLHVVASSYPTISHHIYLCTTNAHQCLHVHQIFPSRFYVTLPYFSCRFLCTFTTLINLTHTHFFPSFISHPFHTHNHSNFTKHNKHNLPLANRRKYLQ